MLVVGSVLFRIAISLSSIEGFTSATWKQRFELINDFHRLIQMPLLDSLSSVFIPLLLPLTQLISVPFLVAKSIEYFPLYFKDYMAKIIFRHVFLSFVGSICLVKLSKSAMSIMLGFRRRLYEQKYVVGKALKNVTS